MMALTDWQARHGGAFAGRRVLVTGGGGFIGSHLSAALVELRAEVVVLDDLSGSEGCWDNLDGVAVAERVEASILDEAALGRAAAGCGTVFHQAAMGSVPRSVRVPRRYHEVNTTGTLNVLEAARVAGVGRVVFAASSSAYGDTPTLPKVETMPVAPRSPYAATKVAGEALLRAYANSYAAEGGPDAVSLRYFNIFGPRQNANSAYAAVIAAFAKALLAGRRPVIFGDGEQSRDFTYVDNAVQANLLAAAADGRLDGAVCNIACGRRVTVNALAAAMAGALGRGDLHPEHRSERAGDVKHSLADLGEGARLLSYAPVVDFGAGLAETVRWYSEAAVGR